MKDTVLIGSINHSREDHKVIDAIHMSYNEYFSKYEMTLSNKLLRWTTRTVLIPIAIITVIVILIIVVSML